MGCSELTAGIGTIQERGHQSRNPKYKRSLSAFLQKLNREGYRTISWLTAVVSDNTMALVEDGTLLGPSRFDMGNSG